MAAGGWQSQNWKWYQDLGAGQIPAADGILIEIPPTFSLSPRCYFYDEIFSFNLV